MYFSFIKCFHLNHEYNCSGRNNADPVGVTWPRGGTRKSRVGKNNTRAPPARSLSRRLAALSQGQKGPLLRPDLSAFARQWRACPRGGGGQTKGHGSGHHDGIIKGLTKDQRTRTMDHIIGCRQGGRSAPEILFHFICQISFHSICQILFLTF
ncbi:hypothetical protein T12_6512 [Trichinella patagoniensis]|uniref:Uncharacterized protein n=1 Tax=Trichinella patagoniensis TaxID=990121 RepID=A0A0V0Z0U8_9BILA|nr:hypothetical protein T12_6512 [Trichinella patagoniensis]